MKCSLMVKLICFCIILAPFKASGEDYSLEHKLAVIDGRAAINDKDHISVARFRSLLDQLSGTFEENRERIADMTVNTQNRLREQGIEESLLNIMEGISILTLRPLKSQQYAVYISMYQLLRRTGLSHSQVIENLKSIQFPQFAQ